VEGWVHTVFSFGGSSRSEWINANTKKTFSSNDASVEKDKVASSSFLKGWGFKGVYTAAVTSPQVA